MKLAVKRWQKVSLMLLVVGVMFLPIVPPPPLTTPAYVQRVMDGGAVVAMVTAEREALEVIADPVGGGRTVRSGMSPLVRRHGLELSGLTADTTYQYTVRDDGGSVRDRGSFRTAPSRDAAAVSFAVVGDSGGVPWWVWLQNTPALGLPCRWGWLDAKPAPTRVGTAAARERTDFWIHTGDVLYPDGKQEHWAPGFFTPFAELNRNAPCFPVLGNHDIREDEGRQLLKNFYLPENGPSSDERMWSLAYGSVRVLGIDCNHEMAADHPSVTWLRSQLESVTEPWVVVVAHYPIYSASRQGDRQDMIDHVLPLLEEFQVDLYLCGHDHNYQRFGEDRPLLVVSGGGGKSVYGLKDHPKLAYGYSGFCFATVRTSLDRLTLRAFDDHSNQLEQVELTLSRGPLTWERLVKRSPERSKRIAGLLGI